MKKNILTYYKSFKFDTILIISTSNIISWKTRGQKPIGNSQPSRPAVAATTTGASGWLSWWLVGGEGLRILDVFLSVFLDSKPTKTKIDTQNDGLDNEIWPFLVSMLIFLDSNDAWIVIFWSPRMGNNKKNNIKHQGIVSWVGQLC